MVEPKDPAKVFDKVSPNFLVWDYLKTKYADNKHFIYFLLLGFRLTIMHIQNTTSPFSMKKLPHMHLLLVCDTFNCQHIFKQTRWKGIDVIVPLLPMFCALVKYFEHTIFEYIGQLPNYGPAKAGSWEWMIWILSYPLTFWHNVVTLKTQTHIVALVSLIHLPLY